MSATTACIRIPLYVCERPSVFLRRERAFVTVFGRAYRALAFRLAGYNPPGVDLSSSGTELKSILYTIEKLIISLNYGELQLRGLRDRNTLFF